MASKEVMASAPLIVLLYDRTFVSGSLREAWRRRRPLYAALASTWILLGYLMFFTGSFSSALVEAQTRNTGRWAYLLTEPGVMLYYLRLAIWPHPLCFDYYGWPLAHPWMSIGPLALVMVILGVSVWACKANSVWGVVGAWFFLILAPSSSFIPTDSPAYEHCLYLPLAAVIVLVVMGIHALVGRRTAAVAAALAVGLGVLTVQRNKDYRSEIVIWGDTVAKRPENARAHCSLGVALQGFGNVPGAIEQYEQALRIKPDLAEAQNNLGYALQQSGKLDEAKEHYEQALRLAPNYAVAHNNLGFVLFQLHKVPEAKAQYEEALRLVPDFADAHKNLGDVLFGLGKVTEAIQHFEQALRINPDDFRAHCNLGGALLGQPGRVREAIGHLEQALQINPDYAEAHSNLGVALTQVGRTQEAMEHFEQALRIKPDYAQVHYNLAVTLAQAGRLQDAIGHYEQALRIRPDYAEARNALARLQGGQ
jgi:tetratricopeptide (TPR) repeat protein